MSPRLRQAPLNEVHSATRERWAANTLVRSDATELSPVPPLEVMFEVQGEHLQEKFQEDIPMWVS